jgi:NADPH:quinone reductase-like Zn-dependent oxidoreductase
MARPLTRRAWCFRAHGGPEVVAQETLDIPPLTQGQLLVKVAAASVNPMDWRLRSGLAAKVAFPRILGRDCAGVVVESCQAKFRVGDEVIATNEAKSNGTHADYAIVPDRQAALRPANLSVNDAVAIGNSGITAWVPLVDHANVGRGTRILIHAAAGGVGGNAIQIARHFGAEIIATCSTRNVDYVRSLGAHVVIDTSREDFVTAAGKCDVVFDTVGGEVHRRSFEVLDPGGLLVYINADPISPQPPRADVRVVHAHVQASSEILSALMDLGARGIFRHQIGNLFSFSDAPAAYAASESRRSRGKNVIEFNR